MPDAPVQQSRMPALSLSWSRFFTEFQKDIKLWLFCMALMGAWRLIFIFIYRSHMGEDSGALNVIAACLNGTRYDSKIATLWMLPGLFLSIACGFAGLARAAGLVRLGAGAAFVACSIVLFRVALGYYGEYRNNFDHWLFGMYYDDAGAVMKTVWAQYNLPLNVLAALALSAVGTLALRKLLARPFASAESSASWFKTWPRKLAASIAIAAFTFIASSGSIGPRPVQLRDAAITTDEFLNKAVVNPYMSLYYAVSEHRMLSRSDGLSAYLPDGDISGALRTVFGVDSPKDIDSCMLRQARGPKGRPPRHVFLIIMESYDTWPLLDAYAELGLCEQLKSLAREGIVILDFLPASDGTMTSYAAIISGLPDAGVRTNYRKTAEMPYPSSLPWTFKRLGYRTRLFYSGYLSWQRIDEFSRAQGFEEIYGGAHMGSWAITNEWGVRDEDLFAFVESKLDDSQPTFNLLLTTTNHPPYTVDVEKKGFHLKALPEPFAKLPRGSAGLLELGHLWYSDKCLGEFVRKVEKRLPDTVFAITGDHFSRKHILVRPSLYERSCVPAVLYGPDVLKGLHAPEDAAGSHLDIGPTLVELVAPAGFEYYTMGTDLLAPSKRQIGLARRKVISKDFIIDASDPPHAEPIRGGTLPDAKLLAELKHIHDCVHAIGWWRVMKGNELPPARR